MRSRAQILRKASFWTDTFREMLRELERRPLHTLEVDLAETARGVVAGLGAFDRVVIDIPEGTVAAERELVIQALTHLLAHALENAPDGSTVTICADSEKSGLRLWVDDHGAVRPIRSPAARRSGSRSASRGPGRLIPEQPARLSPRRR
jgi:signal transduction histidine kinase